MRSLFRNSEIKILILKFFIIQIAILFAAQIFFNAQLKEINKLYINQNSGIFYGIISKNPDLEEEIIRYYTKEIPKEDIEGGKILLSKYGYTENLLPLQTPYYKEFFHSLSFKVFLFLTFALALILISVILDYNKFFNKIHNISLASEKIIAGNFDIRLPENDEGDFYILGHQFNEMGKQLKQSISTLKREKQFLKDIISDISHQLKTPLSSLIMFNEILMKNQTPEEEIKIDFIEKSSEQLSRMEWLIINLLKLARLESGSITFSKNNSNILDTINRSLSSLLINVQEKNQNIVVNSEPNIYFPHDDNWTAEALINIIKNSIEHTPVGGSIIIQVEETPLSLQIAIKDNGDGISPEDIPRIFDRFYKGKSSVNPSSIGIGLALCKSIIEGQGGSINVNSIEGKGTEFKITFLKLVI